MHPRRKRETTHHHLDRLFAKRGDRGRNRIERRAEIRKTNAMLQNRRAHSKQLRRTTLNRVFGEERLLLRVVGGRRQTALAGKPAQLKGRAIDHKTRQDRPCHKRSNAAKLGPLRHVRGHGRSHSVKKRIDPHGARFDSNWFPPSRVSIVGPLSRQVAGGA